MGDSLREQMLKKGLATKKQAKAAASDVRRKAREQRKQARESGQAAEEVPAEETARILEEQASRSRELNKHREEERIRNEKEAQVRDLLARHGLERRVGNAAYHFAHGRTIKTLHIDPETRLALARGQLGIISFEGQYHLTPAEPARKIGERLPEALVHISEKKKPADSRHEEYPIPDDLIW